MKRQESQAACTHLLESVKMLHLALDNPSEDTLENQLAITFCWQLHQICTLILRMSESDDTATVGTHDALDRRGKK